MAITATFTEEKRDRIGRGTWVTGQFSLTGSATAGGFAVTASTFGLSRLDDVEITSGVISATGGTLGLVGVYDKAAGKISLFEGGATANDNPLDECDLGSTAGYLVRVTARGV